MNTIIKIATRDNLIIKLTKEQWKHIIHRHPEMSNKLTEIEFTLKYPEYKIHYKNNIRKYYKYIKHENKYNMVVVKILNGDGFIITSYLTRKIEK